MPRAAFRQAEIERIIRAAMNTGGEVHIDMRQMIIRIVPARTDQPGDDMHERAGRMAQDGKENWEKSPRAKKREARILPPNNIVPDGEENWDQF